MRFELTIRLLNRMEFNLKKQKKRKKKRKKKKKGREKEGK